MGEIYLEILPVENALRVTAIDPDTGIEVVFAAPKYAARDRINTLAQRKLAARVRREAAAGKGAASGKAQPSPDARDAAERGKLV